MLQEKINEPFRSENTSNLTHEFFNDNSNKKNLLDFLVKIVKDNSNVKFYRFSSQSESFFLLNEVPRNKSFNEDKILSTSKNICFNNYGISFLYNLTHLCQMLRKHTNDFRSYSLYV